MTRFILLFTLLVAACTPEEAAETLRTSRGTARGAVGAAADSLAASAPEMPSQAAGADTSWTTSAVGVERDDHTMLLDVRAASHDGFDRIVMDFGSRPLPGYRVEYVRPPVTQCGSGAEVDLPGTGFLSVRMQPAAAHTEEGVAMVDQRDRRLDLPVLLQLTATCDFEADVTWVAALRTQNPIRVLELESPNRIVIDIRHRM